MDTDLILSNQVICKLCGDAPYSLHSHDLVSCECGNVAVAGGTEYRRLLHNTSDFTDISIVWTRNHYNQIKSILNDGYYKLLYTVDPDDFNEMYENIASLYILNSSLSNDFLEPLKKAVHWAHKTRRNTFGLICALARVERDGDFY